MTPPADSRNLNHRLTSRWPVPLPKTLISLVSTRRRQVRFCHLAVLLFQGPRLQALRNLFLRLNSLPPIPQTFIIYAAANSFSAKELPLIRKFLIADTLPETRSHLLYAASRIAGEEELQFFTSILLEINPNRNLSQEICLLLKSNYATRDPYPPEEVLKAFPEPESLKDKTKRWQLALLLRYFPCEKTSNFLMHLAGDEDPKVREASIYSASIISGSPMPASKDNASREQAKSLVEDMLF